MNNLNLTEIRGELEDAANIMRLVIEVSSAGTALSNEARAGLLDVGLSAVDRLDRAVNALKPYKAGSVSS